MQRLAKWVVALTVTGFLLQAPPPADAQKAVKMKPGVLKNDTGVVKTAPPDLIVSKINYSPGKPKPGDQITLWVFVKNIGRSRADVSRVRVKVGGESNPPMVQVPALNPGKEWRHTRKFTMNRAGRYIVTITADAGNQLAESNENNNVKTAKISIKQGPKPDLVISKINYSPGKPNAGDEITLWVFVKNIGPGRADASGARIKIGGDSNPPVVPVPVLNPGKEWRYTKKFTMNRPSNYIVKITADARNEQSETNEANNSKSTRITVAPPPKSDLVVSKISYSPEEPKSYDRVTVQYFVKNIGKGKSGQCALRMTRKSSLGQIAVGVTQVPELAPGQEWLNTQPYFLITGGRSFTFKGIVDDSNRVDESNENNNERVKEMQVH